MNQSIEVPPELVEKVLQVIEKARSTGKIRKGTNEATKVLERGKAKLIAVADDVDPKEVVMHLPVLCEEKDVVCVFIPTKKELGAAAGLEVGCAAVAVVETGDGKSLLDDVSKQIAALKKAS
ncbi:MAG: 50S ribosomal protein L7ae [Candidatus Altiarchaeota archaeon]|nr:50S ribosomal protein L7ae [Candidatus Altiarchaeota archaeon]